MTKPKMVLVEWNDARFFQGTRKPSAVEDFKMARFEIVGYLVSQDEVTTVIASEYNDEGDYRDVTLIPTGSVLSVKKLSVSRV